MNVANASRELDEDVYLLSACSIISKRKTLNNWHYNKILVIMYQEVSSDRTWGQSSNWKVLRIFFKLLQSKFSAPLASEIGQWPRLDGNQVQLQTLESELKHKCCLRDSAIHDPVLF